MSIMDFMKLSGNNIYLFIIILLIGILFYTIKFIIARRSTSKETLKSFKETKDQIFQKVNEYDKDIKEISIDSIKLVSTMSQIKEDLDKTVNRLDDMWELYTKKINNIEIHQTTQLEKTKEVYEKIGKMKEEVDVLKNRLEYVITHIQIDKNISRIGKKI